MNEEQLTNTKNKKKVKLFNKTFVKMQESVKISLKKMNSKTYKIKSIADIDEFVKNIDESAELLTANDTVLFTKVPVLNQFFSDKPQLSKTNKTAVFKYINTLYSLGKEEKQAVVPETPQISMSSLEGLVNSLMSDEKSGFKDIVSDISSQLESSLSGKDIDQTKIVSDLMSGNLKTSGIDFEQIIRNTTKKLEKRVEDGTVSIEELKATSDKISGITKK